MKAHSAVLLAFAAGLLFSEAAWAAPTIVVNPPTLNFGSVLVNRVVLDTLMVTNTGDVPLVVGQIQVSHPAFDAGSRSSAWRPGASLAPSETRPLPVAFRPPAAGLHQGSLTIPTNDPVTPEINILVQGIGAFPLVRLQPDSIEVTLAAGDSATRALTLSNDGDVDLEWAVGMVPPPVTARGGDLAGVNILWDRSHGQQSPVTWSTVIGDLEGRGATVTESTAEITTALLQGVRIFWTEDFSQNFDTSELDALEAYVSSGGGLLIEGDNAGSIAPFNQLLSRLDSPAQFVTNTGGTGITTTIFPHPTTANVTKLELGLHTAKLSAISGTAVDLVHDVAESPVVAAFRFGGGRAMVLSDEMFQNTVVGDGRDNRKFAEQTVSWLVGGSWASATPTAGVLAPDSSQTISILLTTTDLPAGENRLHATVFSNDPANPQLFSPVILTVLGRPDIDVVPSSLAFGSLEAGQSRTDTLTIFNRGEEILSITSINVTGAAFSGGAGSQTLSPGDSTFVPVVFSPAEPGPASGQTTIESNDPDEASVIVSLTGQGLSDCSGACVAPSLEVPSLTASNGFRFGLPVELTLNPQVIDAFGFDLEFDPQIISFSDSSLAGALTDSFVVVSAAEVAPGRVRCAGFGSQTSAIPAGSSGVLLKIFFEVDCDSCSPGDSTNLVISGLTDDLEGINACCSRLTFSDCRNDGDVNADGQLSPGDALCALQIFLNGQTVPADCNILGNCEVVAGDVNCDSTVTAGDALAIYDAYLAGEPPFPCFAEEGRAPSAAAETAIAEMLKDLGASPSKATPVTRIVEASPNPSREGFQITLEVAETSRPARLRVVNVAGRTVRNLPARPGVTTVSWDGSDEAGRRLSPGVYFLDLEGHQTRERRKLVLLR